MSPSSVTTASTLSRAFITLFPPHLPTPKSSSTWKWPSWPVFFLPVSPSSVYVPSLRSGPALQVFCLSHVWNCPFWILNVFGLGETTQLCYGTTTNSASSLNRPAHSAALALPSQLHFSPLSALYPIPHRICFQPLLRHLFSSLTDGPMSYPSASRSFRWDHVFHLCCLRPNPRHRHSLAFLWCPSSLVSPLLFSQQEESLFWQCQKIYPYFLLFPFFFSLLSAERKIHFLHFPLNFFFWKISNLRKVVRIIKWTPYLQHPALPVDLSNFFTFVLLSLVYKSVCVNIRIHTYILIHVKRKDIANVTKFNYANGYIYVCFSLESHLRVR